MAKGFSPLFGCEWYGAECTKVMPGLHKRATRSLKTNDNLELVDEMHPHAPMAWANEGIDPRRRADNVKERLGASLAGLGDVGKRRKFGGLRTCHCNCDGKSVRVTAAELREGQG
jgi:hypothetical protein